MQPAKCALFPAQRGGQAARNLARTGQIAGLEGDRRDAWMAAAAEFFRK